MRHRLWVTVTLLVSVGCGFTFSGKNFIRNGDFEKFNGPEPVGWETTNIGKMLTVVSPVATAHGGSHAVKLEVKKSFGSLMPGMITQKDIAVDGEFLQLSMYYRLSPVGKDAGFLAVDFQSAEGSTVGMCQHYLTGGRSDFTLFKAVTKRPPNATHCEFRLTFMPEKDGGTLHEGTAMIVDDIEMVSVETPKDQTSQ